METIGRNEIFSQAKEWIFEAGQYIRSKMYKEHQISTKSNPNDLVTELDRDTEIMLTNNIRKTYPNHLIISEEGYGDKLSRLDGTVWIIDPIDGTMNFVHQKQNFAISIGIYHNQIGEIGLIYDVIGNVLYSAKRGEGAFKNDQPLKQLDKDVSLDKAIIAMNHFWLCENHLVCEQTMQKFVRNIRGTRTYGSAALEFAYVAEGILDGYLALRLSPWDIAAGIVIVNEVGGVTTTIDGEPLNMLTKNPILTCNPAIQKEIIDYIKKGRKVT
ncbi:MAG TPA: inositol monophosphatase family protein [Cerasibacillus sp.]|uniref:inositol monophosphatase family protein n=1 Tax=Cerasibacillus sp. TaxID=2498711 RepID=UPI002F3EC8C6